MPGIEDSLRFPFVNLEKAVDRAKQLYDGDQRGGEMSVATAFALWNYSEKSSGGNQTVSALKSYGLLVDSGSGESRRIRLSGDGLKYFKDEREDVRTELLWRFATSPPLIKTLWNLWGTTPPSDTVARSYLKVDRGLAEQSARTLLGIYKDNLAFAKLTGHGKILEEEEVGFGARVEVGDYVRWANSSFDKSDLPRRVTWVSDDGKFVRVHGNPTGIPMSELSLSDPPKMELPAFKPPLPASHTTAKGTENDAGGARPEITVLLTGDRLQITADVDAAGIAKLKEILAKYEDILALLN